MAKMKNGMMVEIKKLHSCIESDQKQLAKLYKKAVSDMKKMTGNLTKLLAKAKNQLGKAKKNKKASPKAYQVALSQMDSLKKELAAAKAEQATIVSQHKNFANMQKLLTSNKKVKAKTAKKPVRQMRSNKAAVIEHAEAA